MAFSGRHLDEVRQTAEEENWWRLQPVTATRLQPAAAVTTTTDDGFLADAMAGSRGVEQAQVAQPAFDIINRQEAPPPWQNPVAPWSQEGQVRDRFPLPQAVHPVSTAPETGKR